MTNPTTAERLAALVRDFLDPDPCWLDHHGYCQAHGWLCEGPCPHGRARQVLAEYDAAPAVVPSVGGAAEIASCPGYETSPNPCRCPCEGCKHHCSAHNPDDIEPVDRAALRDRVAEALRPGSRDRSGQYPEGLMRDVDAVLAVLPAPADRAAVRAAALREGADAVAADTGFHIRYGAAIDYAEHYAALLRRLAGEAAPDNTETPIVRPTRYLITCVPEDRDPGGYRGITVEYRGDERWAVLRNTLCLGTDGQWDRERQSTDRDEEWLDGHRYDLTTALRLAEEQAARSEVTGRG